MTMKAAVIHEPGGPEVLKIETRPIPKPRAGEVLIRVNAFGLNRSELFTRQGLAGIGAVMIAVVSQLLDARAASLKRFVAVTPQHQGGSTSDIDLGNHAVKIARLRSRYV